MGLIEELETLSLTVSLISYDQAQQIMRTVNARMEELLSPLIIDVLHMEDSKEGPVLKSLVYFDNAGRGETSPFELQMGADVKTGLWDWVFENRKPVWLENIHDLDLNAPVPNLATRDTIAPKYLSVFPETSSFMAVPLISRKAVRGVYSVELAESDKFSRKTLALMNRLARPLGRILRSADDTARKLDHINEAVNGLSRLPIESDLAERAGQHRIGFVARPFERKYNLVEEYIGNFLELHGIRAKPFKYRPGGGYVIDEIMASIRSSHFCIIDVTGCNPNVFLELGVMIALGKKFLLLRRRGDKTELPFDLAPYNLYVYKVQSSSIQVLQPATKRYEPVEGVLKDFVRQLDADPRFRSARKWSRP
jgi:hypothetical protein